MLHAANGNPLTQQKETAHPHGLTDLYRRQALQNPHNLWKLWTVMKAKKEKEYDLRSLNRRGNGSSWAVELASQEEKEKERGQNSAAGGDTHDERRSAQQRTERRQGSLSPESWERWKQAWWGAGARAGKGLECILKANGSHRKLLS